jgi:hypothetical protein
VKKKNVVKLDEAKVLILCVNHEATNGRFKPCIMSDHFQVSSQQVRRTHVPSTVCIQQIIRGLLLSHRHVVISSYVATGLNTWARSERAGVGGGYRKAC